MIDIPEALQYANKILERHFDKPFLRYQETIGEYLGAPNSILRCILSSASFQAPQTLIIKYPKQPRKALFSEWAALEFLQLFPEIAIYFPRFYGGHRETEILVMEDLSPSRNNLLGYIFEGNQTQIAIEALFSFQKALGKIHARTLGHIEDFQQIRRQYPGSMVIRYPIQQMDESLENFVQFPKNLGLGPIQDWEESVEKIRKIIQMPGDFLAFTHGDATPTNGFYPQSQIRLFDLETAGFRHILLDGVFAQMRYLNTMWACHIPISLQKKSLEIYREEFLSYGSANITESLFEEAFLACCFSWLASLFVFYPSVIIQDRYWGRATIRQRLIAGLENFIFWAQTKNLFPALVEGTIQIKNQLTQQWSDSDLKIPFYEAFKSQP